MASTTTARTTRRQFLRSTALTAGAASARRDCAHERAGSPEEGGASRASIRAIRSRVENGFVT